MYRSVEFGPKNDSFTSYWAWWEFSVKCQNCGFLLPFDSYHQVQLYENLQKSLKMLLFGSKIPNFPNFRHKIFWWHFFVYWTITSCKKSEKKLWANPQKRCYRQADGRAMNRQTGLNSWNPTAELGVHKYMPIKKYIFNWWWSIL